MVCFLRKNSFPLGCWLLGSLWLVLLPLLSWGQATLFTETFGTPTGNTSLATYAAGTAPATFSSKTNGYTYSQGGAASPADVRATSASSGYPNASGGGNTFFASTAGEYGFAIAGINTNNYTGLSLSFGLRKDAAAAYTFTVDYSTDGGATYTALSVAGLPSSTATAGWYGITGVALPAAAQAPSLTLRFRKSGGTALRLDDIVLMGTAGPAPVITTQNPTPTPVCATGTLSVPYTVTSGTASGTYAVQLSDAAGSFAAPTTLSTTSTASPLAVTIPASVAGGTGYLVRVVVGGNTASANPTSFTINNVAVAPTADQTLATNAPGTTLTATETPAGSSRQWYYSTTSGSGYTNAISGATNTAYTPSFAAAGTYYVVVQTAFGSSCSVFSNEVKIAVVAPAIATGTVAAGPYCVGQNAPAAVSIPFTVSGGAFAAGNVFTAYLSYNSFGSNKIAIGTLSGTGSGTITGSIAQTAGLLTRTDYRIRVEASTAASALTDNGTNLSVASYLDNEIPNPTVAAGNTQATLSFAAPATCVTNLVVTIKAGTAAGTKPVAGNTYAPGAGSGTVAFGTGTVLSSGQYVVYNGPATGSITVTGLTNNTRYTFGLFTTNGGATGTTGYSEGTTRSVIPVVPATLTEVVVPQYLSGRPTTGSTHTTRLPYVWRVSLGDLAPSTTYKYYTAVRASTDATNYDGVGTPIETQTAGAFVRGNAGFGSTSSSFTTDANGAYSGWFGLEASANARFTDQAVVYPMVVLNGGDGANVPTQFLATTSPVTALYLSSAATGATGVRGSSFGLASNFVLTYDNAAGTGRPLAGTWLENDGSVNTSNYAAFYSSVEATAGAYGLLTPNGNANGIRRVEQRALADGSLVGCAATSATGTWPSGAATASPSGGTTALVLTSGDAPLTAPTLASLSLTSIRAGQTLILTGTGFSALPNATVVFGPGGAVAAATVNATGTSLTVAVPSGAGTGT
ncbi:MAG: hypothetical protein EOO36_07520, partial [Cytophagaceae bacterium]